MHIRKNSLDSNIIVSQTILKKIKIKIKQIIADHTNK